jgi:tetratricopeptide (TPR) repeat protein
MRWTFGISFVAVLIACAADAQSLDVFHRGKPYLKLASSAAVAQSTDDNLSRCLGAAAESVIDACTVAIASRRLTADESAKALIARGNAYNEGHGRLGPIRNHTRAVEDYNEAIKLSPNLPMAYSARAQAFRLLFRFDLALEDLNKAIQLDPNDAGPYVRRAQINNWISITNTLQRLPDRVIPDRIIEDLDTAIKLDPSLTVAYLMRADALGRKGLLDRAIEDYDQVIKLGGNNISIGQAYKGRGDALESKGMLAQAIEDYDRAIQLDPNDFRAQCARAGAKQKIGDIQGSTADVASANKIVNSVVNSPWDPCRQPDLGY